MLWPGEHGRSPEEGRELEDATGSEEAEEAVFFPGWLSEIVGWADADRALKVPAWQSSG